MTYSLWKGDDRIAANIRAFDFGGYYGGVAAFHGDIDRGNPDIVFAAGTWTHIVKEEDE